MAITALPTPPSRSDPANFADRGDAFLGALPTFVTEANALATATNQNEINAELAETNAASSASAASISASNAATSEANADTSEANALASEIAAAASAASAAAIAGAFVSTSTTTWTPTIESRTFAVQAGEQYTAGIFVTIVSASLTSNWGFGQVTAYSGTSLTVDVQVISGSTSKSDWNISLTGSRGAKGDAGTGVTEQTTGFTLTGGTTTEKTFTVVDTLSTSDLTILTGTQTLTNKTIDDPILTLNGSEGTAGQVPVSQGAGQPPVWGTASSAEIKTPTNVSPASGATDIGATPALTGSTYYSLYGVAMAAGQWQVSTVSDFASTVVNTGDVAGTAVTYNVSAGVLSTSTTYYWRVRYKDANGVYSEWSTATTFTTAASFVPTIGQAYGGGYYTGKIVQGGTTYYLIVAPKSSGESSGQWKTANTAGPADTQTLINGPAASSSMNSASYPAAQFCEGLSIGGYTDWYMPARDELELCYRNLKPTTTANNTSVRPKSSITYPEGNDVSGDTTGVNRNSDPTGAAYTSGNPAQTSVTLFQTGNSEAFAAGSYWSSSEYSSTDAWRQAFGSGSQGNVTKDHSNYVRAVRRVAV